MYSRAYKAAVTIPPLLWVTFFLLVPYAILFCYSFWSVSSLQVVVHNWNLQNYAQLFRNPLYLTVLLRSIRIAGAVTLLALLLGYPLAYYLSFHAAKRKDLLYQLVIIPLWASYLVRGYAWKTILGSDGVLNGFLAISSHHASAGRVFPLQPVRRDSHAHAHLYALHLLAHLRVARTCPAQPGGSLARSRCVSVLHLSSRDPAAFATRNSRRRDVCIRPHTRRFSRPAAGGRTERHHDFQHRGQLVRRGLQLAARRRDFVLSCCCS